MTGTNIVQIPQCGSSIPQSVKSAGADYYLVFETGNLEPSKGFQLRYAACE